MSREKCRRDERNSGFQRPVSRVPNPAVSPFSKGEFAGSIRRQRSGADDLAKRFLDSRLRGNDIKRGDPLGRPYRIPGQALDKACPGPF